jgi:hypothetical protein
MAAKIHINRQFLIKAAIILLSTAFVILTPFILLNYNIEATLIKPAVYKQILADQKVYDEIPRLISEQFVQQLHAAGSGDDQPPFVNVTRNSQQLLMNLDQPKLQELITSLLSTDWAKIKVESIIDQYFASMDNKIYQPNLLIALSDIKLRLQSKTGLSFFVTLMRAQPPCDGDQKQTWQTTPLEEVPACFPSETILKISEPKTSELLNQISARMPDQASLSYFFGTAGFTPGQSQAIAELQNSAARFWKSRVWIRISPAFILILLFLLGLFHTRGRPFTKIWSYPVILAGIAGMLLSLLLWPITNASINSRLLHNLPPDFSASWITIGANVAKTAVERIIPLIAVQSILIGMLGGLLFFADRIRQPKGKNKKPAAKKYTLD